MQSTPTPQTVGARISEAREGASVSREVLAAAAGVSLDTIKRYEAGVGPGPTFIGLCAIAVVTDRPLDWFIQTDDCAAELAS